MKHRAESPPPPRKAVDSLARSMAKWAAVVAVVTLLAPLAASDAYAAGVGKIRGVAAQLLEDLGITSGGVYSGGGADLSAVAEDVLPDADSTRDLGASGTAWAEVHADTVIAGNGAAATPSIRGQTSTTGLYFSSNDILVSRFGAVYATFGATFDLHDDITPNADSTYDLGTPSKAWAEVYADTVHVTDDGGVHFGTGADVREQGELTTLTDGSATTVFSVVTGDGDMAGLVIDYTIQATDATEYQSESGTVRIAIVDDAGGVVASTPGESSVQALSSGTLTSDWTVNSASDDGSIEVQLNANSSLTTSTCQVRWVARYSGDVTLTVP